MTIGVIPSRQRTPPSVRAKVPSQELSDLLINALKEDAE